MNAEKDVFISYAHIDDETLSNGSHGWVTEFHKSLEVRLKQLSGLNLIIWQDTKLMGIDMFTPEIEEQFLKIKVMICILSPGYVKSACCARDLDLFYKAADLTGGIAVENKARIFKVIKTPVDLEHQPEKIRSLLGYNFFSIEEQSGRIIEFGRFKKEIDYWDRLDDLAHDIADLISKINTFSID